MILLTKISITASPYTVSVGMQLYFVLFFTFSEGDRELMLQKNGSNHPWTIVSSSDDALRKVQVGYLNAYKPKAPKEWKCDLEVEGGWMVTKGWMFLSLSEKGNSFVLDRIMSERYKYLITRIRMIWVTP